MDKKMQCVIPIQRLVALRYFQTSSVSPSKISKRRKDTRLNVSPNMQLAVKKGKKTPTELALDNFDDHYKRFFGPRWHSMRLALLSKSKFAAMVNNFSDKEAVVDGLRAAGCINMRDVYNEKFAECDDVECEILSSESAGGRPRPVVLDDEYDDSVNKVKHVSMSKDDAAERLIDPDNIVIGGKASASMYDFVPSESVAGMDDFIEEADYYKMYRNHASKLPFSTRSHGAVEFPDKLDAFVFPPGNFEHFKSPKRLAGPFNYFCMDAASLLPVLMLNLRSGDSLLDICSGPGGKSLAAMQTLRPSMILCNDVCRNRLQRVKYTMAGYLYDKFNERMGKDVIQYSRRDGTECPGLYENYFDKVLCDVPCFADKHMLAIDEGNLFHPGRIRERLAMPEKQTDLLKAALKCTKPGGAVVYSTCTLSAIQNDGVVHAALTSLWEESRMELTVCDLSNAMVPFRPFFEFSETTRFGQLVLPHLRNNFGPMYVAKIERIS